MLSESLLLLPIVGPPERLLCASEFSTLYTGVCASIGCLHCPGLGFVLEHSGRPNFHQPLFFFSTLSINFHRWVTDVKSNDSDENKSKYVLNTSRLLVTILLFIGNVELNLEPECICTCKLQQTLYCCTATSVYVFTYNSKLFTLFQNSSSDSCSPISSDSAF